MGRSKALLSSVVAKLGLSIERIDRRPEAFKAQLRLIEKPRLILDVGANVGQSAVRYRQFFPGTTIHCFEPHEASCRQIHGPNIIAHNLAVADREGTARFNVAEESQTSSLLPFAPTAGTYMGSGARTIEDTEVSLVTLDGWTRSTGIEHVDILKMDVQGAEGLVLAGARRLLEERRISLIFSEVLFAQKYVGQAYFADLFLQLQTHGYRLFGIYNLTMGGDLFLGYGDAIFVAPSFKPDRDRFMSV